MELIFLHSHRNSNDSGSVLLKAAGITNQDCIKFVYLKMTIMFNFGSSGKSILTIWN